MESHKETVTLIHAVRDDGDLGRKQQYCGYNVERLINHMVFSDVLAEKFGDEEIKVLG